MTNIPPPDITEGFVLSGLGWEQQGIGCPGSGPQLWWTITVGEDGLQEILVSARGSNGTFAHAAIPDQVATLVVVSLSSSGAPWQTLKREMPAVNVAAFNAGHEWGISNDWVPGRTLRVGLYGIGGDNAMPGCYTVTGLTLDDGRQSLETLGESEETLRGVTVRVPRR